ATASRSKRGPRPLQGQSAFVLSTHSPRYVVPSYPDHMLPASVPPYRAVLAANMETALNGVWDADIKPGDRVVVIGGGAVGCLAAWLAAKIPGCDVQLVDVNPKRADVARALGCGFSGPMVAGDEADVVIHASGSADGLALALLIAGFE